MRIIEELTAIIENEAEILPFLKKLDTTQKKELYPTLKKLQKYYSEFLQKEGGSYSSRGTQIQTRLLSTAAFVCFNQKDFEQSASYYVLNKDSLDTILPWYCPEWFNKYVDEIATHEFIGNSFHYDWYMELVERGYLQINNLMVAKMLPEYIFEHKDKVWIYEFKPQNLLKREITLREHIWYLFEFETNLHNAELYKQFEDGSAPGRWMRCVKDLTRDGKINRELVLKTSISAVMKNGNQSASNWFMDLFTYLEPTTAEMVTLQDELINTFSLNHSKPANVALKILKGLVQDPGFDLQGFLDNIPLILTSESKTAVTAGLMILEKLIKVSPDYQEQVCVLSCQALIHQDNDLQVRVAKLVQKYGDTNSDGLKTTIQTYYGSLLSDARNLLVGFSSSTANDSSTLEDESEKVTTVLIEIEMPNTFDEFVFLASQAFEQNEPYHFDMLAASILKFQSEMSSDNVLKLMPSFQRAYKMITSDWSSSKGYLDNMLAKFWVSYGQLLTSSKPTVAEPIGQMHTSFVKMENEKVEKNSRYKTKISGIKPWDVYTHSLGYKPHKHILLNAIFMLEKEIHLPLLSTPTHKPCWVSPLILIDRLVKYQAANVIPGEMDFQVAIARCLKANQVEAIRLANQKLAGEYRALIGFVLGEEHLPKDSYKFKPAWLVASLANDSRVLDSRWFVFSNLTDTYINGNFKWESLVENYIWKQYDYQLKKDVDVPSKRKIIRIHFDEKQKKASAFKAVLSKLIPVQSEVSPSIYDNTELKFEYLSAEHNDIKRMFYINPHRVDILLAYIIDKGLRYIDFSSENDKKLIIYTLETLITLNYQYTTIPYLFIASCMICSDKTARTYAAEIWIKGVTEETIDSNILGEIIGKHEQIELAPLKRFTDLVMSNMFQISKKHNKALEYLLANCISEMADKPISGTKKLLELYAEILSANKSKVENKTVIKQLNNWSTNDTMTKTVQKVLNLIN